MISEIWNYTFDIAAIADQLHRDVFPLVPVFQSNAFGGWSVLSSNGSYKDGWHPGHHVYFAKSEDEKSKVISDLSSSGAKISSEYIHETEICNGPIKDVIDFLKEKQLNPKRARIIQLAANTESSWHHDSPESQYKVRFHLPIISNSECFFETQTERQHLAANGSGYFVFVNRLHRVINRGSTNRYHLVVDVCDKMGITQFHGLDYFNKQRQGASSSYGDFKQK